MKKVLTVILCFVTVMSAFAATVLADGADTKLPVYKYVGVLDGTDVNGEVKIGTEGLHKATDKYNGNGWPFIGETDEMSFDKGYLTVTPNPTYESADFSIALAEPIDISAYSDTAYIKIVMKTTIKPRAFWGGLKNGNKTTSMRSWSQWQDGGFSKGEFMKNLNHGETLVSYANWQVETSARENWYTLLVPIDTCAIPKNNLGTPAIIDTICLRMMYMEQNTSRAPLDIKEISIWGADKRADMQIISAKMNRDVKYEVELEFSKAIDASAFDGAVFVIDGLEAESKTYDPIKDTVTLTFDMMPEFPSNLTLSVSGLCDEKGLPTKPSVQIANSAAVDYAALDVAGFDRTADGITLNANAVCIYDKTGSGAASEPQQMTVLLVITKDDVLKACKVSEAKTLSAGETANFTVEIPAESIADYDGAAEYKAEIYLIDNQDSEKPLTKMQTAE